MVTKEQFLEWKAHPVTIEVYEEVNRVKLDLIAGIAFGETIGVTAEETHGRTNRVVGQIAGLVQLLKLTYEDNEELNDE